MILKCETLIQLDANSYFVKYFNLLPERCFLIKHEKLIDSIN